jgi:hypothetical protein
MPKEWPRARTKTPVIQEELPTGTRRATVQAWHLRANERDLKNRKRVGWTDDDAKPDWPHEAGAYRRIESSNQGRGDERRARLERSKPGRFGCHSLPRKMSNGRDLSRPLFPLYKQLGRQRAVQRSIECEFNLQILVCSKVSADFISGISIRLGGTHNSAIRQLYPDQAFHVGARPPRITHLIAEELPD